MAKVLISTLYAIDPVFLAIHQISPDRLILVLDKEPNKNQNDALKKIKDTMGKIIDIKSIRVKKYDIVSIATKVVEAIDLQPKDDLIYLSVTGGRKTQALGLIYAGYVRYKRIKRITYNIEEDKSTVILPILKFKLAESQKKVLEYLENCDMSKSYADLAEEVGISRAMFYRNIDELKDLDFIDDDLKLTDAGKIGLL